MDRYKEIYKKSIGDKFESIIIKYDSQSKEYTYRGYSHHVESSALDKISEIIIDDMVFYAFSEDEIINKISLFNNYEDLKLAAKYAYINRLPKRENAKTDGTIGEILLDIFLQLESYETKKLIARAKYTEIDNSNEIKGYDALYFTKGDNDISLWLGQAKAGAKSYCKSSISDDLQEKYKKGYFLNAAFYIADRKDTNELDELLEGINKLCLDSQKNNWNQDKKFNMLMKLLSDYSVTIKIPCLLAYSKDIYSDENKLKEYLDKEVNGIVNFYDNRKFSIDISLKYQIIFYILPIKDINYIREQIVKFKKDE